MKFIDGILPPNSIRVFMEISQGGVWYVAGANRYELKGTNFNRVARLFERFGVEL